MSLWHTKSPRQVMKELDSGPEGLSGAQAQRRLARWGRNELAPPPVRSLWSRVLEQLKDPMILVLLGAAGLSLLASGGEDWLDAVIILLIVVVNGVISICQEDNARRALDELKKMTTPMARVVREGREQTVQAALVVPGDVIVLAAGDQVPADARLVECFGLLADESAMTGESVPAAKQADRELAADTPVADRSNLVLAGTAVTAGGGRALVVATGMETQMGRIAGMLIETEQARTPQQKKMGEISRTLSLLCLGVCGVMFAVGLARGKGLLDMFMEAVSLAVAAIPEGLPAIVSIVLALGVGRMAKRGAIVKKLPAVETLGCAGIICSDKTGTLTQNRMTVTRIWTADGDRTLALTIAALCGEARVEQTDRGLRAVGDPTEGALVLAAHREGLVREELERTLPRQGQLPFDPGRKLMSTIHRRPEGGWRILVKGAPDVLLRRCTALWDGGSRRLTAERAEQVTTENECMAKNALRVLGVAFRDVEELPRLQEDLVERELTFVGLLGMIDPPRPEVRGAVERCARAGIRPIMITGDHKATAVAVARELNILRPGDLAVTGAELDLLTQEMLEQDIERFSVFARVTPEHKLRIVRAWQKRGQVTAMTGDGVNDAPALKAADIGCAMGKTGTDVAKGAAHMILTDDNFATIVGAVEEGRGIYSNIRKAIHYLLSCNVGEILTIFAATVLGLEQMPLVPVQLLWLNLVTDSLPALALGVEPVEDGVMEQPPRDAGRGLFTRSFALRLGWQGLMVGGLTLTAYFLGRAVMPMGAPLADATANTMAFATLTLSQLFHAYNVRSEDRSVFSIGVLSNPAMNKAFLVGLALQLAVLCLPPLQGVFSVIGLGAAQWLTVFGLAAAPVAVCELAKLLNK